MQAKKTKAELQDKDLLRYNRNIVLPEIDIDGQLTLSNSKVAVIGLGGLGCPAATYLASSGIGNICLVDFDSVSLSNMNRQVLFNENNISEDKVIAAKRNLNLLNSDKQASRTKAIEIFPEISNKLSKKKDINKADAILIASFFNNTYKLED